MADFSSIYDLPDKTASFSSNMMGGGSCGDDALFSPVYTKVDPNGYELLSLDDLSNSEFDYLNSDVGSSLDQDWLIEPVSLPSPEEQDNDIKYSPLLTTSANTTTPIAVPPQSLPLSVTTQFCVNSSPSSSVPLSSLSATSCMLTPDPSLPPSPNSILSYSSEEEEIQDVLASFNNESSNSLDIPAPFAPSQMLPFDTSPQLLDVDSPSSCLMSTPSSPEDDRRSSFDSGICSLLDQSESSSRSPNLPLLTQSAESVSGHTERSRKRKSLPINSDQQSSAPAPAAKRRLNKSSKKERKREQNKTAALRYRQKKKGEKKDIEVRQAELEDTNKKLRAQVASLENEINYLKKLSHEVHKRIQNK